MKLNVVIRAGEDGFYVAECPALPGCVSQGRTKREVLAGIREAIEGVLMVLNARAKKRATNGGEVRAIAV